jgi:type IV pilus assembly protein PilB
VPVPNGCEVCRDTGYSGRTAIHEVMPVTREVAALIAERAASVLIGEAARNAGYEPIQQRALQVVAEGNVTFEDARRMVALDPDYGTFAHLPE